MESDSTNAIAMAMDSGICDVMPDSWHGHARLKVHDADLSDKQKKFAETLSLRLLEKEKVSSAERAAAIGIKKAQEKL